MAEARGVSPIGTVTRWPSRAQPGNGWLLCDGTAVSRSTYSALFAALCPTIGTASVTASSADFALNAHGLQVGDSLYLTGTMPTGLTANSMYYVRTTTVNTFTVTATAPGTSGNITVSAWVAATANVTPSGSGSVTVVSCPFGLGDGSTTFNLPDSRGRLTLTRDPNASRVSVGFAALGRSETGQERVTLTASESGEKGHDHGGATYGQPNTNTYTAATTGTGTAGTATANSNNQSANHSHGVSGNTDNVGPTHSHGVPVNVFGISNGNVGIGLPGHGGATYAMGNAGSHNHNWSGNTGGQSANHSHSATFGGRNFTTNFGGLSIGVDSGGASSGHNNIPPFLVGNCIIRAL